MFQRSARIMLNMHTRNGFFIETRARYASIMYIDSLLFAVYLFVEANDRGLMDIALSHP